MKEWVEEFLVKTVVQTIGFFALAFIAESLLSFYHNDIWYYVAFALGMMVFTFVSVFLKHHK